MKDNVVDFDGITRLDIPPAKVLATAAGAKLSDVVVIGWRADGELYFAASTADGAEVNWLMGQAKLALLVAGTE